jgi:hypothetical protein
MSIVNKFKGKDITLLKGAINREYYLDVKNEKLYRKVCKFYENQGVIFSDDPLDNYDIVIDCLEEDLQAVEI